MKLKENLVKVFLGLILLLALLLRTINLNTSPPGFNADEASLGYNAYSLLKTGKDEWGNSFPLVFKSFSDYKPGVYVYLDMPFVALLGLNELAVRLPSILLGTLSVLLIYLLSKEIFREKTFALSSAFLLSISPWHIHFSRGAWESNVATFFILLGVYAFIKGLKSRGWLFVSSISLILSMYTYQSPRVSVPLLVLLIIAFYYKKLFIKKNILSAVVSAVILIPFLFISLNNQGLARFQGLSIFNDSGPGLRVNVDRGEHDIPSSKVATFYHNKLINYSISFLSHYSDHFSPRFLFIEGDILGRNKVPEMGQMYIFELITLLTGLYFLIRRNFSNKKLIWLWLLVAPFAAALTYQTPSALRSLSMVIPLTLISGLGLGILIQEINKFKNGLKITSGILGIVVISFFFLRFLDLYFIHLPKQYALEWEYGFSTISSYIETHKSDYQKIKITDRYDQPYILLLFYSTYDPLKYQSEKKTSVSTKYGFSTITGFDKYEFGPVSKNDTKDKDKTLIVGTPLELSGVTTIYSVPFPNNEDAFLIAKSDGSRR